MTASTQKPVPSLIEYTNLLFAKKNPNAHDVRAYVDQHSDDPVFLSRVRVINTVYALKRILY